MPGDSQENSLFGLFTNGWWLAVRLLNCGSRPSIREVTHSGAILQISQNNEEHVPGRQLPAIDEAVNSVGNGEYDRASQVSLGGRSESCQVRWLAVVMGALSVLIENCQEESECITAYICHSMYIGLSLYLFQLSSAPQLEKKHLSWCMIYFLIHGPLIHVWCLTRFPLLTQCIECNCNFCG